MPFPSAERMIFRKNTLIEVICQVRFPPILQIETELPTEFQNQVRAEYPFYQQRQNQGELQVPDEIKSLLAPLLQTTNTVHEFTSEDEDWTISLSTNFLALKSSAYIRWEGFYNHLAGPMKALREIYKPAFFTRSGLRYINAIDKSRLGLTDIPWSLLLKDHLAGELGSDSIASEVMEKFTNSVIKLNNHSQVRLRHGLGKQEDNDQVVYLIDSDFFTDERVALDDISSVLEQFNGYSRNLFHWCITGKLRDAMEPEYLT